MWLLDFLGCWLLAVGSWLLAVLEYTPIGLLGPLAGCLNCGSYEHGILIISLEKFSSVFSLASLQLARLVFSLVFWGLGLGKHPPNLFTVCIPRLPTRKCQDE